MPKKFISNSELLNLLQRATTEELLILTKIFDSKEKSPYSPKELQLKISKEGGHSLTNLWRGQGTGYLDIVSDVAKTLKIKGIPTYNSIEKYDDLYYIKNEADDVPTSNIERLFDREEAIKLGLEYASLAEEKIIIELIKKSYEMMTKNKEDAEKKLLALKKEKSSISTECLRLETRHKEVCEDLDKATNDFLEKEDDDLVEDIYNLRKELETLIKKDLEIAIKKEKQLKKDIQIATKEMHTARKQIDDFDNTVNKVAEEYNVSDMGKLSGTAGFMVVANLGGFATYTFLTSMMSVVSMGSLGFGAYTAATSLLSIVIGPVGWAGLGVYAAFSLGKPNMTKLMPIVATVGTIRQRLHYEEQI